MTPQELLEAVLIEGTDWPVTLENMLRIYEMEGQMSPLNSDGEDTERMYEAIAQRLIDLIEGKK